LDERDQFQVRGNRKTSLSFTLANAHKLAPVITKIDQFNIVYERQFFFSIKTSDSVNFYAFLHFYEQFLTLVLATRTNTSVILPQCSMGIGLPK
jgi:hypothetical protein